MIHCALEVRYINAMASRTGKSLWHLGCKFITLSPSDETLIQRFMARIEAERRALTCPTEGNNKRLTRQGLQRIGYGLGMHGGLDVRLNVSMGGNECRSQQA